MKFHDENKSKLEIELIEKDNTPQQKTNDDLLRGSTLLSPLDQRRFFISITKKNKEKYKYQNNHLKTTKYTFYNFLPFCLFRQFERKANIYFLVIMILSLIPQISPVSPLSAVAPFIFVLGISVIREAFEDYNRFKNDKKENEEKVLKYNFTNGVFEKIFSQDLEVGDIIKIEDQTIFPADILLLSCSNLNKTAYIETSNLDGEKNLKPKQCLSPIYNILKDGDKTNGRIRGKIYCDKPNSDLYKFNGKLKFNQDTEYLFNIKQFLYKGTILKNTKWIVGVVAYTGVDTKIILNSQETPFKSSKIEQNVNKIIILIFFLQTLMCIILTICFSVYYSKHNPVYIMNNNSLSVLIVEIFFTFQLLLNTMIPISLIVSLEFVKIFQGYFMNNDVEMYSKVKDKMANANTYSLNEELGQVKYIFSDKTGTLTSNKLEFKGCAVGENIYGLTDNYLNSKEVINMQRKITFMSKEKGFCFDFAFPAKEIQVLSQARESGVTYEKGLTLLTKDGLESFPLSCERDVMDQFLLNMSLNHSCFVENDKPENIQLDDLVKLKYRGESPDDIILVDAAKHFGYCFLSADDSSAVIARNYLDNKKELKVELLKTFEYSSTRGMMSTIVRIDGRILLFSKGGNKKINELLVENQPFLEKISERSTKFSEKGLRVLWFSMRLIGESEYKKWEKEYEATLIKPLPQSHIEKLKNGLMNDIEKGQSLIGCTAVEDKLQDNVPESIKDFHRAGINFWVLTGDNLQTAKNIGLMCELLNLEMETYEVCDDVVKFKEYVSQLSGEVDLFSDENIQQAKSSISLFEQQFDELTFDHVSSTSYVLKKAILLLGLGKIKQIMNSKRSEKGTGILIESDILKIILPHEDSNDLRLYQHPLTKLFLDITLDSKAVLCCRVSPKQKALVVRLVQRNLREVITLAVGDGANDVSMIKEANVGIGIYGEEGTQAAMNSDYAIGEFKCLRRLILHHGRYNYLRLSEMILYFFYKNFVFTFPQFYFAFFSIYSGQTMYDSWYLTLYNTIFTAFPLVCKAILEQDVALHCIEKEEVKDFVLKHMPYTYYNGRLGKTFSIKNFILITLLAIGHSAFIFIYSSVSFDTKSMTIHGDTADLWSYSILQFTIIMFVVSSRITVSQKYHTFINFLAIIVTSWVIYIIYSFFAYYSSISEVQGTLFPLTKSLCFYLTILIVVSIAFIIDFTLNFVKFMFTKTPVCELMRLIEFSKEVSQTELELMKKESHKKILEFQENLKINEKSSRILF